MTIEEIERDETETKRWRRKRGGAGGGGGGVYMSAVNGALQFQEMVRLML